MQVCHFGFALSFLLSFLCHFIVLWEMQNKCIENNSQSANCKTPSTKRNREKCRPLKFGAPHFDGFLKSSRKCYIYIIIYLYICAHGFGDLSISFRYTFWETPRALGQATVYNPCGSSNPRTQSRRGFKMRGSPGHAMPCLKHGEPGEPPGMELNTKTCYLCFGNHYGNHYIYRGKKHGKIILRNWVQDSASHL